MWRGKPERVPWCSSIHHSKFLIGLNPRVIHLRGFLNLILGLGPLIGLFDSFLVSVHWYLSLCLGNLYLQYQFFSISIHFQFFLVLYFIWKTIKNIKKMTFLLHLPYSNDVGVILAWLDTSIGLLGGRFHLLACSWVRYEQNKTVHYCFCFFKTQGHVHV